MFVHEVVASRSFCLKSKQTRKLETRDANALQDDAASHPFQVLEIVGTTRIIRAAF